MWGDMAWWTVESISLRSPHNRLWTIIVVDYSFSTLQYSMQQAENKIKTVQSVDEMKDLQMLT